jgi:hypothetical protein
MSTDVATSTRTSRLILQTEWKTRRLSPKEKAGRVNKLALERAILSILDRKKKKREVIRNSFGLKIV